MTYRILIVDDMSSSQLHLRSILSKEGYEVGIASSYEEACEQLESSEYHLLLMDVFMPEVDGFEACIRLRKQEKYKMLPIVFVTASEEQSVISRCFESGGSDYIGKFSSKAELLARVSTQLRLYEVQQAEREEHRLLTCSLNAFSDDIIIVTSSGEINFMNHRARQLLHSAGCGKVEHIDSLPNKIKSFFALDEDRLIGFLELRHPIRMLVDYQQRLRRVSISPVIIGKKHMLLLSSRDTTEENRMQRHLRNAHKMTTLSQIAGGLAHDLNNVLGGTITYLSMLKMHADDRGRTIISNLESANYRASELIGQLLDFSRQDEGEQQVFSLSEMLNKCKVLLQRVGGEDRCEVFLEFAEESLKLNMSRILLQQALLNSAQKIDCRGGGLRVFCQKVSTEIENLPVQVRETVDESWCVLSLGMQGYEFFSADSCVPVAENICGLSLSIASSIMEDVGGRLFLEGETQAPSAVHFFLPLYLEERVHTGDEDKKVLVLEEDRLQSQLLSDVLEMLDYIPFSCSSWEEIEQNESSVLAVIVDCEKLNSPQVLESLKKYQQGPVVIAASSRAGHWMNVAADNSWQFLAKPYRIAEIQKVLATYAES